MTGKKKINRFVSIQFKRKRRWNCNSFPFASSAMSIQPIWYDDDD